MVYILDVLLALKIASWLCLVVNTLLLLTWLLLKQLSIHEKCSFFTFLCSNIKKLLVFEILLIILLLLIPNKQDCLNILKEYDKDLAKIEDLLIRKDKD